MPHKRILSFKYALNGLLLAFKEEPNLRIHFIIAFLVIILGFFLTITRFEWLVILTLIGLVIGLELTNTALETIVDSFTEDDHPAAKKAKDVSAAAVFVVSIVAAFVGLIIFVPYIV